MRTILDYDTLDKLENVVVCVVPVGQENHYDPLVNLLPNFRIPIVKVSTRYPDVLEMMEYDPYTIDQPFMIWIINKEWVSINKNTSLHLIREMEKHYVKQIQF
jgi:hypothetical protein